MRTPTPWYFDTIGSHTIRHNFIDGRRHIVVDGEDSHVGIRTVTDENMKHIIKCVNAHDELMDYLRDCAVQTEEVQKLLEKYKC